MREVYRFLEELRQNNNREWFNANKEWYLAVKAEHEAFINRLIPALAKVDPEVDGLTAKDCIFRIYRDVRFFTTLRNAAHPIKSLTRLISGLTW